jgi:hypothetical protein
MNWHRILILSDKASRMQPNLVTPITTEKPRQYSAASR